MEGEILKEIASKSKESSKLIFNTNTETKNNVLRLMAKLLKKNCNDIIKANKCDLEDARNNGIDPKILERLIFDENKIQSRIDSLLKIAALSDPVGQIYRSERMANGLIVGRMRVPLGVILMIYEARPHVTINAGAFCLKSGNSVILRGGSEAERCNALLGELWKDSLINSGLLSETIQVISGSHEDVDHLLKMHDYIDLVIPRGSKGLIKAVGEKSKIPVIKHFEGICHVYIDKGADIDKGINIALDSKCLMPEVCNAMETLLVCESLISFIPKIVEAFRECGVTIKGCYKTKQIDPIVELATEEDWKTEYLDPIVSIRIVEDVDEAIEHINTYGSHHTDVIITDSKSRAEEFVQRVDSAVVLVNASTMFCDGKSLGMGAEIGISTDKLHARGPMGLEELTSYKFVILGNGHVMGDLDSLKRL